MLCVCVFQTWSLAGRLRSRVVGRNRVWATSQKLSGVASGYLARSLIWLFRSAGS